MTVVYDTGKEKKLGFFFILLNLNRDSKESLTHSLFFNKKEKHKWGFGLSNEFNFKPITRIEDWMG